MEYKPGFAGVHWYAKLPSTSEVTVVSAATAPVESIARISTGTPLQFALDDRLVAYTVVPSNLLGLCRKSLGCLPCQFL